MLWNFVMTLSGISSRMVNSFLVLRWETNYSLFLDDSSELHLFSLWHFSNVFCSVRVLKPHSHQLTSLLILSQNTPLPAFLVSLSPFLTRGVMHGSYFFFHLSFFHSDKNVVLYSFGGIHGEFTFFLHAGAKEQLASSFWTPALGLFFRSQG